jgi:hypothetical protein
MYSSMTSYLHYNVPKGKVVVRGQEGMTVHQAFVTEDLQRQKCVQDASGGSQALAARFGFKKQVKNLRFLWEREPHCGHMQNLRERVKMSPGERAEAQDLCPQGQQGPGSFWERYRL